MMNRGHEKGVYYHCTQKSKTFSLFHPFLEEPPPYRGGGFFVFWIHRQKEVFIASMENL